VMNFLSTHQTKRKLNLNDIMRFLEKAKVHPIIGHRFKDLTDARIRQIGERMLALLTYSFDYDRIYVFKCLFNMHSMMALHNDEVNAFFNLLMKEGFTNGLDLLPSQLRILNRMKTLILYGDTKAISHSNVLQFKSILQSNPILKERFKHIKTNQIEKIMYQFTKILDPERVGEELIEEVIAKHKLMWISAEEYDEFTKVFLELHYDRDFLSEAAAVRKKLRDAIIVPEPNYALQVWRAFIKNDILAKRFADVEPRNIKIIIEGMIKLIEEYPRGANELEDLAKSHVYLKLSELELMEFERTFLSVKEITKEYRAKLRVVFGDFTKHLRDNNGISSSLFF